ncbi:MAG: hypothetical protein ACOCT9_02445, partial [archaeon]
IEGAKGALIHVSGGNDMTLAESNSVAEKISQKMDVSDSMVIWGARVSDEFDGFLRIMLLITGIKSPQIFGNENTNETYNHELLDSNISRSKLGLSSDLFDIEEISFD